MVDGGSPEAGTQVQGFSFILASLWPMIFKGVIYAQISQHRHPVSPNRVGRAFAVVAVT
jgi:hypothetical protein